MVAIMTNEKNNPLFNAEMKNNYLKDMIEAGAITEETSKSYSRIFGVTSTDEVSLDKDLNQFTAKELDTVLYGFKANNRNTVESYARIISSYLKWSVQQKLTKTNHLANLKPSDFEKYLTNEEVYFSYSELRRYEEQCVNPQDAIIFRLLFMGVGGKQMSEIRNLSKDDVYINGKSLNEVGDSITEDEIFDGRKRLKLVNTLKADDEGLPLKFTTRYIDIDSYTMNLIIKAIEQKTYVKRNGDMEEISNIRPYTDLVNNNYVVRASITKTENWNKPVDKFVIYRRIDTIAESLGLEKITAKFIQRSGMMYHANELIMDEELSLDDLKIIADRYNIKSYHNLKGIVTLENIRKTYSAKSVEGNVVNE